VRKDRLHRGGRQFSSSFRAEVPRETSRWSLVGGIGRLDSAEPAGLGAEAQRSVALSLLSAGE